MDNDDSKTLFTEAITSFRGRNAFLSNFYPSEIKIDGLVYKTVEHYYQSKKTNSKVHSEAIRLAKTPGLAKRMGSKKGVVINNVLFKIEIIKDWDEIKDTVMYFGLLSKFKIPELSNKLIATFPAELIEGNLWHDNYWGICFCDSCKNRKIQPLNRLGVMLTNIRSYKIKERGE